MNITVTVTVGRYEFIARVPLKEKGELLELNEIKQRALLNVLKRLYCRNVCTIKDNGVEGFYSIARPCKTGGFDVLDYVRLDVDMGCIPDSHIELLENQRKNHETEYVVGMWDDEY